MSSTDIYQVWKMPGYEWVIPTQEADIETFEELSNRRPAPWRPLPVMRYLGEPRRRLKPADLPWYGGNVLILTMQAREALEGVLAPWGDLLPLECVNNPDPLWVFACRYIDAFDEERSDVVRLSPEKILLIKDGVFKPGVLPPGAVFKIPQVKGILTTSDLVDRVREADLTGCDFKRIGSVAALGI